MSSNNIEAGLAQIRLGSNEISKDLIYQMIRVENVDELKKLELSISEDLKNEQSVRSFFKIFVGILKMDVHVWNKSDRIKMIFNDIDDKVNSEVVNKKIIIEQVFDKYFDEFILFLENHVQMEFKDQGLGYLTCLWCFPLLLDIKLYEPLLFSMTKFIKQFFQKFNNVCHFQMIPIQLLMQINHKLINYLAIPTTPNGGASIGAPILNLTHYRGLSETIFIYTNLKTNLVNVVYTNPEIIASVLTLLEQRSRFFGMTADAIPENVNQGDYIVVDTMNAPLEDDDVYEEYERFLADLPPQ